MIPEASAAYYRDQRRLTMEALAVAVDIWGTRPPRDFDAWFDANIDMLIELVLVGQRRAVETADGYVSDVLDELGDPVAADVAPDPEGLIGVASDGRALDSLMYGAVITAKGRIADGAGAVQAWDSGLAALVRRVQTQLADAARVSTGLSIVARPGVGYVRMLNPPSCSRCAILAGKFFRWNSGFRRHPGCDCRHIPTRENRAGDLTTDPQEYFDSLTSEQQDKLFTKAGAEAIRSGADINQVVNASRGVSTAQVYGRELVVTREGVTRRGVAYSAMRNAGYAQRQTDVRRGRYFEAKAPRLMPETIYEIAEDRDDALRLLRRYGYMSDRPMSPTGTAPVRSTRTARSAPSVTAGGGGGRPPRPPVQDARVGGDDDGEQLARQLDEDYETWSASLSSDQRLAIRQWQRADDRFYQRIQNVLRTGVDDDEAERVVEPLLEAIDAGALQRDVAAWRGIRNSSKAFGVPNDRLSELVGREIPVDGLMAVSTARSVAGGEFVDPSFGGGPVLMRVAIKSGTPAAWVKLVGDPTMGYQRELLLSDGHTMRVVEVSYTSDLPLVDVEVI